VAFRDGGIDVYFAAGDSVGSNDVIAAAAHQFEQHLAGSFFTGPVPIRSKAFNGSEVIVQPSVVHRRRVIRLSLGELASVIRELDLKGGVCDAQVAQDAAFQRLLGKRGTLAAAAEQRTNNQPQGTQPQGTQPAAEAADPQPAVGNRSSDIRSSDDEHDLSINDEDSEPEQGESLLVFRHPFHRYDDLCEDIFCMEDLDSSQVYVIAMRGYRPSRRPHRVFIWRGSAFDGTDDDINEAYTANLCASGLRFTSRTALSDVAVELCEEGEEPDELLLALA
jgi:hypothetical protein